MKATRDASLRRYGVHLTPASNLASIGAQGLLPSIGAAAKLEDESEPLIYMYADLTTVDADLARRTGDLLNPTQQIAALLVDLSDMRPSKARQVLTVNCTIPPARLDLLTPNLACAKDIETALRAYTNRRDSVIRRLGIQPESWGQLSLADRWEALSQARRIRPAMLQRGLPGIDEERHTPRFRE